MILKATVLSLLSFVVFAEAGDYCVAFLGTSRGLYGVNLVSKYHVTCDGIDVETREQVFTISKKANESQKSAFLSQMSARKLLPVSKVGGLTLFRNSENVSVALKSYCLVQIFNPRHNTGPYFLGCTAGGLKEMTVTQPEVLSASLKASGYKSLGPIGASYKLYGK